MKKSVINLTQSRYRARNRTGTGKRRGIKADSAGMQEDAKR